MKISMLALITLLTACASTGGLTTAQNQSFEVFLQALEEEAQAQGLNAYLIKEAFGPHPKPFLQVVKAQDNQAELKDAFTPYFNRMLSPTRIQKGGEIMAAHKDILAKTSRATGIPEGVIVALWGAETNYGGYMGNIPVIKALATLAYTDTRRPAFFRRELFNALKVAELTGKNGESLQGSWAGAVGQNQFMPSNWFKMGRDGDGDGKVNLIDSEADVVASTANYLVQAGWIEGQGWKWLTMPPENHPQEKIELNSRNLSKPIPLIMWKKWGYTTPENVPENTALRFYQPVAEGPNYLLGPNFDVILDWNYSSFFAFSVLSLADILKQES